MQPLRPYMTQLLTEAALVREVPESDRADLGFQLDIELIEKFSLSFKIREKGAVRHIGRFCD